MSRLAFLALLPLTAVVGHDYTLCTDLPVDHVHISSLNFDPDDPPSGKPVVVSFNATPDIAIPSGSILAEAYLFGVLVPGSPTFDLCKDVGLQCPLLPGAGISGSITYDVPSAAPTGIPVTLKLPIKDSNQSTIGCVQAKATIGSVNAGQGVLVAVEGALTEQRLSQVEKPPEPLPGITVAAGSKARRALLDMQYASEPAWSALFGSWREQFGKRRLGAYASVEEEAKRYQAFKANIAKLHRTFVDTGVHIDADERSDWTHDELNTLAHFA